MKDGEKQEVMEKLRLQKMRGAKSQRQELRL
jgi:predicted Fe-S protein YdhL (DUF1289 family)